MLKLLKPLQRLVGHVTEPVQDAIMSVASITDRLQAQLLRVEFGQLSYLSALLNDDQLRKLHFKSGVQCLNFVLSDQAKEFQQDISLMLGSDSVSLRNRLLQAYPIDPAHAKVILQTRLGQLAGKVLSQDDSWIDAVAGNDFDRWTGFEDWQFTAATQATFERLSGESSQPDGGRRLHEWFQRSEAVRHWPLGEHRGTRLRNLVAFGQAQGAAVRQGNGAAMRARASVLLDQPETVNRAANTNLQLRGLLARLLGDDSGQPLDEQLYDPLDPNARACVDLVNQAYRDQLGQLAAAVQTQNDARRADAMLQGQLQQLVAMRPYDVGGEQLRSQFQRLAEASRQHRNSTRRPDLTRQWNEAAERLESALNGPVRRLATQHCGARGTPAPEGFESQIAGRCHQIASALHERIKGLDELFLQHEEGPLWDELSLVYDTSEQLSDQELWTQLERLASVSEEQLLAAQQSRLSDFVAAGSRKDATEAALAQDWKRFPELVNVSARQRNAVWQGRLMGLATFSPDQIRAATRERCEQLVVAGAGIPTSQRYLPRSAGMVIELTDEMQRRLQAQSPELARRIAAVGGFYVNLHGRVDLTPYRRSGWSAVRRGALEPEVNQSNPDRWPVVYLGEVGAHHKLSTSDGREWLALDDRRGAYSAYLAKAGDEAARKQMAAVLGRSSLEPIGEGRHMVPVPLELAVLVNGIDPVQIDATRHVLDIEPGHAPADTATIWRPIEGVSEEPALPDTDGSVEYRAPQESDPQLFSGDRLAR